METVQVKTEKKRERPWVAQPVPPERREEAFKGLEEYCARFRKSGLRDMTLVCIAGIQKNVARPSFSDVWAAFVHLKWDTEKVTQWGVQQAIYELASERGGRLFEMGVDEGKTLVLWPAVLKFLDALPDRENPYRAAKREFAVPKSEPTK